MKRHSFLFLAFLFAFGWSGCASKPRATPIGTLGSGAPVVQIVVSNGTGAPSWAYNEKKAVRNALEVAATSTLAKGYRYFAVVYPAEISNLRGVVTNTAEEFLKRCTPSQALVIDTEAGLHRCGTYNTKAVLRIALYRDRPLEHTVYDAREVLAYLKKEGLYENLETSEK